MNMLKVTKSLPQLNFTKIWQRSSTRESFLEKSTRSEFLETPSTRSLITRISKLAFKRSNTTSTLTGWGMLGGPTFGCRALPSQWTGTSTTSPSRLSSFTCFTRTWTPLDITASPRCPPTKMTWDMGSPFLPKRPSSEPPASSFEHAKLRNHFNLKNTGCVERATKCKHTDYNYQLFIFKIIDSYYKQAPFSLILKALTI